MTEPIVTEPAARDQEQLTCAGCGQTDNHPKSITHVGVAKAFGTSVHHPDDADKDGWIEHHFDCLPEDQIHPDEAIWVSAARDGLHGDALRAHIVANTPQNLEA